MSRAAWIALGALVLGGVLARGWLQRREPAPPTGSPASPPQEGVTAVPPPTLRAAPAASVPDTEGDAAATPPLPTAGSSDVQPYDAAPVGSAPPEDADCPIQGPDGWLDLAPILRSIGRPDAAAARTGEAFANANRALPVRPEGHYRRHSVADDPRQALVLGAHGEVFYSRDAERRWTRVSWRW